MRFDCSWTGLEWKIDESFRELGFFSSGWIEIKFENRLPSAFLTTILSETCMGSSRECWCRSRGWRVERFVVTHVESAGICSVLERGRKTQKKARHLFDGRPHALLTKFPIKIPCFRAVQCPEMKMKSAGNFWTIFLIIFDDEYFVLFSILGIGGMIM